MSGATQTSIRSERVAIVGAGGLGGPLALALCDDARRTLALIDDDRVELSNLQRQIQFRTEDVGLGKVEALASALIRRGVEPERVVAIAERVTPDTIDRLLSDSTVVVEGTDAPDTKFLVNDWCVRNGTPYVIAAVGGYGGNVFCGRPGAGGCYRCLFETPPPPEEAPSCADTGVLGATVGFVAGVAALCADELTAAPSTEGGRLLVFDDLRRSAIPRTLRIAKRPTCAACSPPATARTVASLGVSP